jgi:radical SAM superfamily enzyme YgiQ (UPF0313 family)
MSSIILITPTPPDISAFGVRSLSAVLRKAGHRTRIVFFPGSAGMLQENGDFVYHYDPGVIDALIELCRGFDYIGISFMTYYLDRAIQITQAVKKKYDIPVVWGGIHTTCKPEEALMYADMACVGEGETALTALLDGETDIAGFCRKDGNKIVQTGTAPLIRELNSLPFFDFSNENHFIYTPENRHIELLTDDRFERVLPRLPYFHGKLVKSFRIMTDRGCPHRCNYCNVPAIKRMYENSGTPYFRNRNVPHVIDELELICTRFPFIEAVQFFDDTFFARKVRWLEEFSDSYRSRIQLPFYCQTSPTTLTQTKLDILMDAGMVYVEMGIQTGSQRIRHIYNREETSCQIVNSAEMIHRKIPQLLPPDYHVIIDSPWEDNSDLLDTVKLLQQIPKPFGLAISSLIFFPETELYHRAVAEGFIRDEFKEIARKPFYVAPQKSYPHFLLYLTTFQHIPEGIFRILLNDRVVRFFEKNDFMIFYKLAYFVGESSRLIHKGMISLAHGDFKRILDYFKKLKIKDAVVAGRKA